MKYEDRPSMGKVLAAYVSNGKDIKAHLFPIVAGGYVKTSAVDYLVNLVNDGTKLSSML